MKILSTLVAHMYSTRYTNTHLIRLHIIETPIILISKSDMYRIIYAVLCYCYLCFSCQFSLLFFLFLFQHYQPFIVNKIKNNKKCRCSAHASLFRDGVWYKCITFWYVLRMNNNTTMRVNSPISLYLLMI